MSKVSPAATAARLRSLTRLRPTVAVVLGSGFNHVLSAVKAEISVPYARLPGFPPVGVAGHPGHLLVARVGYLKDGRAVEFSQSYYRGEIYDFVAELSAST